MAVVSSVPVLPQRVERIRLRDFGTSRLMERGGEIEEEAQRVLEDKIFVAVGKNVKESILNLKWVLQNTGGQKICFIHVHQPSQMIPLMGGKFPANKLEERQVKAYRELERQNMYKILKEFILICARAGVRAEELHIEMDNIEKGIVDLVAQQEIRKLVMGAAADKHYSKKMTEPKSKKATFVQQEAHSSCHILFVCKGNLIYTREGTSDRTEIEGTPSSLVSSPITRTGQSDHLRSRSVAQGQGNCVRCASPVKDFPRASRSPSQGSEHSTWFSIEMEETGRVNEELYDQLEQTMVDDENSKREAFSESDRRWKSEKDAIDAKRKAKAPESLYTNEMKRKEREEVVAREKIKKLQCEVMEKLHMVQDQKSALESHIAESDRMIEEFGEKIVSAVQLLKTLNDNAVNESDEASSSHRLHYFSEFSFLQIKEATCNFDPLKKIGEGGYGSVYRGLLRNTQVAIKILHSRSLQGPAEFQQEVDVLSRVRHPNLVTLIGACPEAWSLIYEYLPNGSLEDRLVCRDGTLPLSWQIRIRIATEICSALIFLHSNNPHSIVHGDLKPANILLDANFVSKLGDFGICRMLRDLNSANTTTLCHITIPKGTPGYMDPEFFATGELTLKSDVYSFGVILLRLLTGRPPVGIVNEVQYALAKGNLTAVLDSSAGNWPSVQAKELVHLGLKCCEMNRRSRPDLESEVWRVLEPMMASCGPNHHFRGSQGSIVGFHTISPPPISKIHTLWKMASRRMAG